MKSYILQNSVRIGWELGRGECQGPKSMRGMTLIELAVVLLILVALAGVTLMMTQNIPRSAECVATDTTLANIREAIMGGTGQAGYLSDMGRVPEPDNKTAAPTAITLNVLFNSPTNLNPQTQTFNPVTQRGWRGPYLTGGITCNTIFNVVQNHIVQGYALSYDIDREQLCNLPTPATWTPISIWASATASVNGPTVALDSFPVIATNLAGSVATVLQGSPIVLMRDATLGGTASGKYFLVSGGPAGGIETTPTNVENRLHPGPGPAHIDDRVLYLDSYDPDPNGNNPCSN